MCTRPPPGSAGAGESPRSTVSGSAEAGESPRKRLEEIRLTKLVRVIGQKVSQSLEPLLHACYNCGTGLRKSSVIPTDAMFRKL